MRFVQILFLFSLSINAQADNVTVSFDNITSAVKSWMASGVKIPAQIVGNGFVTAIQRYQVSNSNGSIFGLIADLTTNYLNAVASSFSQQYPDFYFANPGVTSSDMVSLSRLVADSQGEVALQPPTATDLDASFALFVNNKGMPNSVGCRNFYQAAYNEFIKEAKNGTIYPSQPGAFVDWVRTQYNLSNFYPIYAVDGQNQAFYSDLTTGSLYGDLIAYLTGVSAPSPAQVPVPTKPAEFTSINIVNFTSNGTYVPSPGMRFCMIEVVGGGGGSGSYTAASWGTVPSQGGGGGGYARGVFTMAQVGDFQLITVGTRGFGGCQSSHQGCDGGVTSVGVLISATGGKGGANGYSHGGGGVGGIGLSGNFTVPGGSGSTGITVVNQPLDASGGNSFFGSGVTGFGNGVSSGGAGGYGGGGAGSCQPGLPGIVVITEYVFQNP